ncbi:hypothetical protein HOK021_59320 [Streptomyces hygroscopicus]|nr:hypothetical protein HOK021_59320 [Streptomyces hygroscopicus]
MAFARPLGASGRRGFGGAALRLRATASELSPAPSPLSPFGGGGGGGFGGGGMGPRRRDMSSTPPRDLPGPRPRPSWTGKATVTIPVLNRGRERACMRPWEAAKCDRKINCQWGRLGSKTWVTQTCANSRPR